MKIAIFGASGKTGIEVIKQALEQGHDVTVMVRDPDRLPKFKKDINIFKGELSDNGRIELTLKGQDAVICTLGSRELYKNSGIRTIGTRSIIQAMEKLGISRLVVMSSMGIGESWKSLPLLTKVLFKLFMPAAREDHEAQELAVKSSALDWTIIRPSGLTNNPNLSNYEYGKEIKPKTSRISRANVAELIIKVIDTNTYIHEAITISN